MGLRQEQDETERRQERKEGRVGDGMDGVVWERLEIEKEGEREEREKEGRRVWWC